MIVEHRYDVVIVGAGGAGMRAAVEAGPRVRTAVLTSAQRCHASTSSADPRSMEYRLPVAFFSSTSIRENA